MQDVLEGKDYSFPKQEEQVLDFWERTDAFKQQLKRSEGKKPYVFYDGPPFATGLPHYGHLLAGTLKVVSYALREAVDQVSHDRPALLNGATQGSKSFARISNHIQTSTTHAIPNVLAWVIESCKSTIMLHFTSGRKILLSQTTSSAHAVLFTTNRIMHIFVFMQDIVTRYATATGHYCPRRFG